MRKCPIAVVAQDLMIKPILDCFLLLLLLSVSCAGAISKTENKTAIDTRTRTLFGGMAAWVFVFVHCFAYFVCDVLRLLRHVALQLWCIVFASECECAGVWCSESELVVALLSWCMAVLDFEFFRTRLHVLYFVVPCFLVVFFICVAVWVCLRCILSLLSVFS